MKQDTQDKSKTEEALSIPQSSFPPPSDPPPPQSNSPLPMEAPSPQSNSSDPSNPPPSQSVSPDPSDASPQYLPLLGLTLIGIILSLVGFIQSNNDVVLIGLCIILGLDVKFIDQLIDEESMRKYRMYAIPLAILIPLFMGYLATIHDPVFGMVIGTALGLLLAGKLDHPAFLLAAVGFVIGMGVFVYYFNVDIATTSFYLIPMTGFGAYGDEFGHEKVSKGGYPNAVYQFFEHRFLLKTVAAISVLVGFAEIIHLVGFLCWDLSYDAVAYFWDSREKVK